MIRRIRAVSLFTMAKALRMKTAAVLLAFLFIVVPAMPLLLKGDGTPEGRVYLVLAYSLNVAFVLSALLAVFLAVTAVTSLRREKMMQVLEITPLRRWEMLAGTWLGVSAFCGGILLAMFAIVYLLVSWVVVPSLGSGASNAYRRVLIARKKVSPRPPDLRKRAEEYYESFRKRKLVTIKEKKEVVIQQIIAYLQRHSGAVPPRTPTYWRFEHLPPPLSDKDVITVRYKVFSNETTPDGTVNCTWFIGKKKGRGMVVETNDTTGSFHEFEVPASLIGKDGTLEVGFMCRDPVTIVFASKDGLQLLYRAGTFEGNLLRCYLVSLAKLSFLAGTACVMGAAFSLPVAAFCGMFLLLSAFALGSFKSMITESGLMHPALWDTTAQMILGRWLTASWKTVNLLIPAFDAYPAVYPLATGILVETNRIAESFLFMPLLRGGAYLLLGAILLHTREPAALEE